MANGGVAEEAVVVWSRGSDTAVSFITVGHCLSAFIKIIMRVHNWEAEGRASSLLPKHCCRPRYKPKSALISKIIFFFCSYIVLHMVLLSVWYKPLSVPCLSDSHFTHLCGLDFQMEILILCKRWYWINHWVSKLLDRIKHDTIILKYFVLGVGGRVLF